MKKIIIYFSVMALLIIVGYFLYYSYIFKTVNLLSSPNYASLLSVGYNNDEINKIEKLDQNVINEILKVGYNEDILDIIKEDYFILSNLKRYINAKSNDNYIELVNANRDLEQYSVSYPVDLNNDYLILVNKYYKLNSDYVPSDLVSTYKGYGYLREYVNNALIEMYNDAKGDNITLNAQSTYRSYDLQSKLYTNYSNSDGVSSADRYSARPGNSEHQTGLVIDFMVPGSTLSDFYKSKDFTWLKNNSYKYGFILRYPDDKEDITGYMYEAWHFRYVGVEVAKYIHEKGITFDEYFAYFIANKKD